MNDERERTRRNVLRTGTALGAAGLGLGTVGTVAANPGEGGERGNGKQFGRVYGNDVLWRTNVVTVLDDRPDPEDRIYFLHDGDKPIVARDVSGEQASPFVSESAPGDRNWNGGQWTHFSAEVTDVEAFDADVPLASATDVLEAEYIEVSLGRPRFGPPNYFVCPLNGRA